jgi:tetratricopeptide (TPR) repeat protein
VLAGLTANLVVPARSEPVAAGGGAAGAAERGDAVLRQSRRVFDARALAEAEAAYQEALASEPGSVDALVGLGWVASSRHDFATARGYLEKALSLDPAEHRAHSLLCDGAVERGDYEAALDHAQAALDARPGLDTYSRAAQVLWLTGDARRAGALMDKAAAAGSSDPHDIAWCRAEAALMAFHAGSTLVAGRQAELATSLSPACQRAWLVTGHVMAAKGEASAAIASYLRALEPAPADGGIEARTALVELYRLAGDDAAAEREVRLVEKFAATAPGHQHGEGSGAGVDYRLAKLYADQGRELEKALEIARRAHAANPNVFTTDTLAWCLHLNGHHQEAQDRSREALRHGTPLAEFRFHAGMIEAALGNRQAAQQLLYQALNANPHFHPRFAQLAADRLRELGAAGASPETGTTGSSPGRGR